MGQEEDIRHAPRVPARVVQQRLQKQEGVLVGPPLASKLGHLVAVNAIAVIAPSVLLQAVTLPVRTMRASYMLHAPSSSSCSIITADLRMPGVILPESVLFLPHLIIWSVRSASWHEVIACHEELRERRLSCFCIG